MNSWRGRNIISIKDLSKEDILYVLEKASQLKQFPQHKLLDGCVMGSCFFEPSTRTRLSFETAMSSLGGSVVGFADAKVTSTKKGETLYDTITMVSQYVDVIAMRHPLDGAARRATDASKKPIINGGDGANQHPTQTILDLLTIKECQGKLEGLSVAMVGDLKYGRTVHSLSEALTHFGARQYFVAPRSLQMPTYICNTLKRRGIEYSTHERIEDVIPKVDILYMTRIQEERFPDKLEYERIKNVYVLTPEMLDSAKENMKIMHPLPRVNEIDHRVDNTKHAYYFQQAANGLFARQALISLVLGKM